MYGGDSFMLFRSSHNHWTDCVVKSIFGSDTPVNKRLVGGFPPLTSLKSPGWSGRMAEDCCGS